MHQACHVLTDTPMQVPQAEVLRSAMLEPEDAAHNT